MKLAPVPILSVLGLPIYMVQARIKWVRVPNYFIRAVLQIERSVNGLYTGCIKKGNPTLACHCALIAGCKKRNFCTALKSKVLTVE